MLLFFLLAQQQDYEHLVVYLCGPSLVLFVLIQVFLTSESKSLCASFDSAAHQQV